LRVLLLIIATVFLLFLLCAPARASNYSEARRAIIKIFGPYADEALRVARCETGGTYDPRASNGQYQGIFQMGEYARGRYGHGPSWLVQAAAAFGYFIDSGRDWSPWSCRP
jgi:hypothetical protein